MAKQNKSSKTGFVIKLSSETVQKLTEEEQLAKSNTEEAHITSIANNLVEKIENISEPGQTITPEAEKKSLPGDSEKTGTEVKILHSHSKDDESDIKNENKSEKSADSSADSNNTSWGDYAPYVSYEADEAIYTDPLTQQKYTWNAITNSWDPKSGQSDVPGRVYSYEDDTHVYTETDGSKFFWDVEKKAWIPKVDDDFLAFYQMSYGFVDNAAKEEKKEEDGKKKEVQKKTETSGIKRKNDPQWFDPSEETNTKVYVSNLPLDSTEEEFVDLMQKCGLVERDPHSQKMKVKLYMDKEQNCFKGDALCTYIKIESVVLALQLLDGSDYKGNKIKVEKAHFQLKGDYNPALKPKKKKKKELEKIKKMQQKLFDWRPEKFIGERSKHERVVIVKNLFHPSDFDKEVQLILDYQQDLREECSKSGEVRKVVIYDRHPEGVAQITMKEPEQADAVIQLINGRWFGKKQISAEIWDGRTKYRIAETDADLNKRIDKWDKFLEAKDEGNKESAVTGSGEKPKEDENVHSASTSTALASLEETVKDSSSESKTEEKASSETAECKIVE